MVGLLVALGGGIGGLARYGLDGAVASRQRSPFPFGTLIINVSGSAALGALVALLSRGILSPTLEAWVGTGVVGGYTTFSTFTYETVRLLEDGAWRDALANVALSGPLSFAAAGTTFLLLRGR